MIGSEPACVVFSHYLNQYWLVKWKRNIFWRNLNSNTTIFLKQNVSLISFEKGVHRSRASVSMKTKTKQTNKQTKNASFISNLHLLFSPTPPKSQLHNDVIKWKHFPRYWPFVRGIHRSPVNPRTKASDVELWCFLWSALEQTVKQTIARLVIWDAIAPIMTSL